MSDRPAKPWAPEGDLCSVAGGPLIVFIRHSSTIDTLIPTELITRRHGLKLRFVMKTELLADPCLDVAGHWVPNYFV